VWFTFSPRPRLTWGWLLWLAAPSVFAEGGSPATLAPELPGAGLSLLRVLGALALVLALFFAGVWLFRNWQRLLIQRGRPPKLQVLEVRPLGQRQALYVVGFETERFLISASPAGINLLTPLPKLNLSASLPDELPTAPVTFGQVLGQVLKRP
jgi:flagellar biogenesis protein FliO